MTPDLYDGSIDWDAIYRTFHSPVQIAERIRKELGEDCGRVLFSGFLESASLLAKDCSLVFVDSSSTITVRAQEKHPSIGHVYRGDVTEIVGDCEAENVVIACRISAYWDDESFFMRLVESIKKYPRNLVLIDFFDREQVALQSQLSFANYKETGLWKVLSIEDAGQNDFPLSRVNMKVSYEMYQQQVEYEGCRSFFRKKDLLGWFEEVLPLYTVTAKAPLLVNDPGFVLKISPVVTG